MDCSRRNSIDIRLACITVVVVILGTIVSLRWIVELVANSGELFVFQVPLVLIQALTGAHLWQIAMSRGLMVGAIGPIDNHGL